MRYDAELALPTVTIAEIAFGIDKIRPDERAPRLAEGLMNWRRRFADRIFGLTEEAALAYGEIMGGAVRQGRPMSAAGWYDRRNCQGEWGASSNAKPARF